MTLSRFVGTRPGPLRLPMEWVLLTEVFVTLFVIMDPVGTVPHLPVADRRPVAAGSADGWPGRR